VKEGGGEEGKCERERALDRLGARLRYYSHGRTCATRAFEPERVVRSGLLRTEGSPVALKCAAVSVCVFITAGPSTKLFTWGGVCVYYCRTYYKAVCGGGGGQ
jgi:hypothetical protein